MQDFPKKKVDPQSVIDFVFNTHTAIAIACAQLYTQTEDRKMQSALGMLAHAAMTCTEAIQTREIPVTTGLTRNEASQILENQGRAAIGDILLSQLLNVNPERRD